MPIIVISAHDWTEIEEEAREAGVTAFISKPFFRTKFVHVFHDLLSHHDTHADRRSPLKKLEELSFEGRTVLLAEDNPINAEITINILQMMGLTIERAENGEEAVKIFSESSPGTYDLVFMDIQMPVMNGYEATKAIRALRREDAAEVPIIAMTANAFEDDRQNALRPYREL